MRKKLRFGKRGLLLTVGLLLAAAVVLIPLVGQSRAKFKTQLVVANQVSYQNELAESFQLLDQPVVLQEDGSYLKKRGRRLDAHQRLFLQADSGHYNSRRSLYRDRAQDRDSRLSVF